MERNPEAIILRERAVDFRSIRAVLREWGYGESEIEDLLRQQKADAKLDVGFEEHHGSNRGLLAPDRARVSTYLSRVDARERELTSGVY